MGAEQKDMKKVCVLFGSPRKNGNTAALLSVVAEELTQGGADMETIWLYEQNIHPCTACRACQRNWSVFGCSQQDDMQMIFDSTLACDLLMLAMM